MLFWLALVLLLTYLVLGVEAFRGSRRIAFLRDASPSLPQQAPTVTVIAAARNEEKNLREALQSLLALDYPRLHLLLVNDRSEDQTGTLLDEMAATDARLEVLHISALPDGWLGKNHALWQAARKARGELLLFTDADVVMAPDTLRRAVNYLQNENLDHLCATPQVCMPGTLLTMLGVTFGLFLGLFTRPWRVRDPRSACHIGIGAFNLVWASVYHEVGGHQRIALRPDDDLKLGKIIKRGGFRQALVYGTGLIAVEWYAGVREMIRGLEKNIFAGFDYRLPAALGGAFFLLMAGPWPYLALLISRGPTLALYAGIVLVISLLMADAARLHGFNPWYALGYPVTTALLAYIVLRALVCNLRKGGIEWRGTFYPLRELRKNRV